MSLPSPIRLAAADVRLRWRRHYDGHMVTVGLTGRAPLTITPGHPVLTHAGWRRAAILAPGVHVVVTEAPFGVDADMAYYYDRARFGEHPLPTLPTDFRGDGADGRDTHIVCCDDRAWPPPRPWAGDEGHRPTVDKAAVTAVLDALCSPAEFRVATWSQACARVVGLAEAYPDGPVVHHAGLDDATRRRLGNAIAALPAAPVDRPGLGDRLLAMPAPLRLIEVTSVTIGPTTAVVHDVTTTRGVILADGVVVTG